MLQFAYHKATGIRKLNCYVNQGSSYKILAGSRREYIYFCAQL